jgi:hypothetical protein
MKTRSLFFFVAVALCSFCGVANENSLGADHIFRPLLGKKVTAEGLAWGSGSKGLGERVVLPSGISIYFTGTKYSRLHRNGRLVRVVGRISVEQMKPAPPNAQGYTEPFDYYALNVESVDVIDVVTHEFPELLKK